MPDISAQRSSQDDSIRIRMLTTVIPDFPFLTCPGTILIVGREYDAASNRNGAILGICKNGEKLGVKPGEFEFISAPKWILKIHGKDGVQNA